MKSQTVEAKVFLIIFLDDGSHKTVEIKVFLNFLLVNERIQICANTNNDGSGSGKPKNTVKNIQIRILKPELSS
jgi:hypothetical protein